MAERITLCRYWVKADKEEAFERSGGRWLVYVPDVRIVSGQDLRRMETRSYT